jgi:MFS family permease
VNFRWRFVLPLAVAQMVSWGSLYYAFAVLAGPMAADLGWSKTSVDGALSAGLAATGLASPLAGRMLDKHGGRIIMTVGSIVASILLLLWSQITELWQLFAIWLAMGATLSTVLYEPVFAVMARALKDDYRRAIITITLLGGLASTIFIPLSHVLEQNWGWRHALMILAAIQIPFGVLIHWIVLKSEQRQTSPTPPTLPHNRVRKAMDQPIFWFLAISYAAHSFMFTGLTFHIIPMLTDRGFALPLIIAAYAIVGPFQVVGRILVFAFEQKLDTKFAGSIATFLPVIGLAVLIMSVPNLPLLYLFAVLYGSGMGIKTIVQATAGPELLGREGYGALQGAFAGISYAVQAATPFTLAVLWSVMGSYDQVFWIIFGAACLSALAFQAALAMHRRLIANLVDQDRTAEGASS